MQVDFKITTWERVDVPEEHKEAIVKALESGEITTANDLIEFIESATYEGIIDEVSEQMNITENDGQSTIEAIIEGKTIWENGVSN